MTAETTEWAGPGPLPAADRAASGATTARCTTRASPTRSPFGYRPLQLDLWVPDTERAGTAGRLDPRRRLDVRRPPLPAGDAAAEPVVRRAARRRSRRRHHRLPARAGGAVPRAAARREGGRPLPAGARRRARHLDASGSGYGASRPAATSPPSSASPRTGPTWRAGIGVVGPSSAVDVVVDWYGPADLHDHAAEDAAAADRGQAASRNCSRRRRTRCSPVSTTRRGADASPITHVTPAAPPFLLVHGTADWLVPYAQSEQLHAALTARWGADCRLESRSRAPQHIFDGRDDIDAVVRLSVDYLAEGLLESAR